MKKTIKAVEVKSKGTNNWRGIIDEDGVFYNVNNPDLIKFVARGGTYEIEFEEYVSTRGKYKGKKQNKITKLKILTAGEQEEQESGSVLPEQTGEVANTKRGATSLPVPVSNFNIPLNQSQPLSLELIKGMIELRKNELPPAMVIEDATTKAKALKNIVDQKKNKVIINGKQYLEYEDWQTLGKFYGLSVRTGEATPVTVEGVKGAKAMGYVHFFGIILSSAEAYCMRDEDNWKKKPYFQLASMAQTRAGAKALRNKLAWVAVLAGYSPTPAEEMSGIK